MCHPNSKAFTIEPLIEWMDIANLRTIDIPIDTARGSEFRKFFGDFKCSEIASVPNLVDVGE